VSESGSNEWFIVGLRELWIWGEEEANVTSSACSFIGDGVQVLPAEKF
jgi:hypothetical protein